MAIEVEIVSSPRLGSQPGGRVEQFEAPVRVKRLTAAGTHVPAADDEVFLIRCLGDTPVLFRAGLTSDAAAPAADDLKSIRLLQGQEFPFSLPKKSDASLYTFRVA